MYSLRKSKKIFLATRSLYLQKKTAPPETKEQAKDLLSALQIAIMAKDTPRADTLARKAKALGKGALAKSPLRRFIDSTVGLIVALFIALLVRSMWFELYEIPSGSMRPTFKEQDRLVVSKTTFGINFPLKPKHLLFDPALVKRSSVFIFSGQDMAINGNDTLYFYLIPGKKQYIKRLMGKPGDTLYFYGGKIYGIDQNGNDISPLLEPPLLHKIDHIPFLSFLGTLKPQKNGFLLSQMGEDIAKLSLTPFGTIQGSLLKDVPHYFDLWGMKNFAMTRLITNSGGDLLVELSFNPSLSKTTLSPRGYPILHTEKATIPLTEEHQEALMNALYTARFKVEDGVCFRPERGKENDSPRLEGIPNGTYEFYNGVASQIFFSGISKELPRSHPIYTFSKERLQLFYNLGIDFSTALPSFYFPHRYAYFQGGALHLLGSPIFAKEDPTLIAFLQKEENKKELSLLGYAPFVDHGPPLLPDGSIDNSFIKKFGLHIPEGHYLALGDNHAMSGDSRIFGFIPEGNIRGAPSFIFWPPGPRFGAPLQLPYPHFTLPKGIIYLTVAFLSLLYYRHRRKETKLPLKI